MTQYYAVLQIDGPFHGVGTTPSEAIEDARQWSDDIPDDLPTLYIGSHGRSLGTGTLCIASISEALYEEIRNGDPDPVYHRCVAGILEAGTECELDDDNETPEESEARRQRMADDLFDRALMLEAEEINRRLNAIKRERREMQERSQHAREEAAKAWEVWLESIEYAYKTHRNYVANNMPLADRERLAEPTPANVLETARRRNYAPEWATVAHMYRAIQEIEERWRRARLAV